MSGLGASDGSELKFENMDYDKNDGLECTAFTIQSRQTGLYWKWDPEGGKISANANENKASWFKLLDAENGKWQQCISAWKNTDAILYVIKKMKIQVTCGQVSSVG